jgi:hypothetical protein
MGPAREGHMGNVGSHPRQDKVRGLHSGARAHPSRDDWITLGSKTPVSFVARNKRTSRSNLLNQCRIIAGRAPSLSTRQNLTVAADTECRPRNSDRQFHSQVRGTTTG